MGHITKLIPGKNDLLTVNPVLAKEWHPTKNGDLRPDEIAAHSQQKVWWLGSCGHEWDAVVDSRANGRGCPYCHGQKVLKGFNDLATIQPHLVSEWMWEKNAPLSPDNCMAGSHKHVWWKCSTCGHEWSAEIRMRAKHGQGCPECGKKKQGVAFRQNLLASGKKSLFEEHPEIAQEWHPTKNQPLTPADFTAISAKRVWWKCRVCGHEWPTSIQNRTSNKTGCPVCSGHTIIPGVNDFQTKCPTLAAEWHPTKNLPLTPDTASPFSSKNVWWICKYGHEYKCRVADRQKGVGCSECSKRFRTSLPEKIVEYYVQQHFTDTISNYRPDCLLGAELDIYIPSKSIGIEYDGQRYHKSIERDQKKDMLCLENGIRLIRIREPKCPPYKRKDPTIVLHSLRDDDFSKAIQFLFGELGFNRKDIDVKKDKQAIIEAYRNTAINGSIAEKHPDLSKEWHPTLNGFLKPENIPATKSPDLYYWQCKKCGHSWKTTLYERIAGSGCPACNGKVIVPGYNDLATTHPDLAKEWHPTKNGDLTPQKVSKGQSKTVWWVCPKCGHEWSARIKNRTAGSGCRMCAWAARKKKK